MLICIRPCLYKCSIQLMHAWLDFTEHHTSITQDRQGSFSGISARTVNARIVLCPVKEWLTSSANSPSSRLPPTLPALCYCVTLLRERACIGTLRPGVHKRRGWRSSRRAQGSKQYVRSSGTPIWLCNPSTDKPLFLLKLSFHSPSSNGTLTLGCSGRAQGWAGGDLLILKI